MKHILLIAFLLILNVNAYSQTFDIRMFERLTTINEEESDDFLINGYDYQLYEEDKENLTKRYFKVYNDDWYKAITVEVIFLVNKNNFIQLRTASFQLSQIKENLISNGYLYQGRSGNGRLLMYEKDTFIVHVQEDANEKGARSLLIFNL